MQKRRVDYTLDRSAQQFLSTPNAKTPGQLHIRSKCSTISGQKGTPQSHSRTPQFIRTHPKSDHTHPKVIPTHPASTPKSQHPPLPQQRRRQRFSSVRVVVSVVLDILMRGYADWCEIFFPTGLADGGWKDFLQRKV